MKILTNPSYNLSLDKSIKDYCKMYLSPSSESDVPKPSPVEDPKPVAVEVPPKASPVNKATVEVPPKASPVKKAPVKKPAPVEAPKLIENSDIESISDSEVDMIVSKVRESLKPAPTEYESDSEAEDSDSDSDDYMLDADEIHDEEGNTYYIDAANYVIKLNEDGYGVIVGMLKELKCGNILYKTKRWKIDYSPKN
jgi:hypothetical protein